MVNEYELVVYTDVWGDENEWTVNNQMIDDRGTVTILDDASDEEILTYLHKTGTLSTDDPEVVRLVWMDDSVAEIEQVKDGFPIGRLQRVEGAEKAKKEYTCTGCKYLHACGDPERTAPCDGYDEGGKENDSESI